MNIIVVDVDTVTRWDTRNKKNKINSKNLNIKGKAWLKKIYWELHLKI